jgi:hypothetical protein
LLWITGCAAVILSFILVLRNQHVTRQQVLDIPNAVTLSKEVNQDRQVSIAPRFIQSVLNNKGTVYMSHVADRYMQAFSVGFLFTTGEGGIYGTYRHGVLYLFDAVLLLLGLYYLFRNADKKVIIFIIGSILLAPLPSVVTSDVSYALRGIHLLPPLMILAGCGWYQLLLWCRAENKARNYLLLFLCVLFYIASVLNFINLYFFRYSIYGAEYWFESSKIVAELAGAQRKNFQHIIIGRAGKQFMFQYGVYNGMSVSDMMHAWKGESPYAFGSVSILDDCLTDRKTFDPLYDLPPSTLYITRDGCHRDATPSATIRDWGEPLRTIWKIYFRK